jgi:hypothetical protein
MGIKGKNTLMDRPRLSEEMSVCLVPRLTINGTGGRHKTY